MNFSRPGRTSGAADDRSEYQFPAPTQPYCTVAVRFAGASGGWLALVANSLAPIDGGEGRRSPAMEMVGTQGDCPPATQEVVPAAIARLPAFRL